MNPTVTCLAYRPAVCKDRATTVQVLLRLNAPRIEQRTRRPLLNLGIAIDRSGSMGGEPMQRAREAAAYLIRQLDPTDRVSVVAFDDQIDVLTPCRALGRAEGILENLDSLEARGGTDLHRGWSEACHQVEKGIERQRLNRVILLSDGQANTGITQAARIQAQVEQWQRKGISTSTVGLGLGYNEDLLAGMAQAGNGNFYHVNSPSEIETSFAVELSGLSRTYGTAVSLGIEGLAGVEILRVYNVLERTAKGRLKLADLVQGAPVEVVIELLVPAIERPQDLCQFRLAWTSSADGERHSIRQGFSLPVVPHGQLSEFPVNEEVYQKRAVQLAGRSLKEAVGFIDQRDYQAAKLSLKRGLEDLQEAQTSPELEDLRKQMEGLVLNLDQGHHNSVRKTATCSSRSIGYGSIVLSGIPGLKEFMALPVDQRTPEKLRELTQFYEGLQS